MTPLHGLTHVRGCSKFTNNYSDGNPFSVQRLRHHSKTRWTVKQDNHEISLSPLLHIFMALLQKATEVACHLKITVQVYLRWSAIKKVTLFLKHLLEYCSSAFSLDLGIDIFFVSWKENNKLATFHIKC